MSSKGNLNLKIKKKKKKKSLEAAQLKKEINCLEKNKIDVDSFKDNKEFIKNNKLIPKTQQRFRSEKHNVFTEEIDCFKFRS